jgi:hypothetical protein
MMGSPWASSPLHGGAQINDILLSMENSAPVALIATYDITTCNVEQTTTEIRNDPQLRGFDFIPVTQSERIIGIIERTTLAQTDAPVRDCMKPLDESVLISSDASLLSFVAEVDEYPVRLVLEGRKITGIITISDLQKLAVRPLLFMLVTSVELLLAEWIRQKTAQDEDWLSQLSEGRQDRIRAKWDALQVSNLAIDLVTTTDFCDKRDAFLRLAKFEKGTKKATERNLKAIEKLRDSVAHAGDYALTPEKAVEVAKTVRAAKDIIQALQTRLSFSSAL